MDTYSTKIEELQEKIGDIQGINQNEKIQEDIYLFFSFDLVNSTSFKAMPDKASIWPIVITHFYELIQTEMRKKLPEVIVWKYLGDEILLYLIIKDIEEIYESPRFTYNIQKDVMKTIRDNFNIKFELDIKSTIWIAGVTRIPLISFDEYKKYEIKNDSIYRNIEFSTSVQNEDKKDFLGQDIDVGFRIAKYANKNKVTISTGLAYLLNRMDKGVHQNIDKEIKIVSFEMLKGVWNSRAYPIIWYYPDWNNVMESFDYDEHKSNEIVNIINGQRYQGIEKLENILKELGFKEYHDKFNKYCKTLNRNDIVEVLSK